MTESLTNTTWDVIIIGGGICGISLGALLAHDNHRVLVLEQSATIGGRARVVEQGGFILDFGIHTVRFGAKSALAKTLETVRAPSETPIRFDPLGTGYFFLNQAPAPHWEVFPTGLKGITKGKYFSIFKIIGVLLKLIRLKGDQLLGTSVAQWQQNRKLKPQGQLFLKLVTGSMQVCPFLDRASIGELNRNLREVVKKKISVTYPPGGWKLIFERLTNAIERKGGQVLTKQRVDGISIHDGQATGVKCSGQSFAAKQVVYAAPVQNLFDVLGEDNCPADYVDKCKLLRPTAGLSLDVALKQKISEGTGLYYFDDPVAFGFFTSNLDPAAAPQGKQLFTIFAPCNHEDLKDAGFRDSLLAQLKAHLAAGFPEMAANTEFERPLFLPIVDGAEVNTSQYTELRPNFIVPCVRNLFLVGDSTAGGGAGGDIGHNSVWGAYAAITGKKVHED